MTGMGEGSSSDAQIAAYVPQLLAAIKRHDECENWCTWDNVLIAAKAVEGDPLAQESLRTVPAWQLTPDGLLPASSEEVA